MSNSHGSHLNWLLETSRLFNLFNLPNPAGNSEIWLLRKLRTVRLSRSRIPRGTVLNRFEDKKSLRDGVSDAYRASEGLFACIILLENFG